MQKFKITRWQEFKNAGIQEREKRQFFFKYKKKYLFPTNALEGSTALHKI